MSISFVFNMQREFPYKFVKKVSAAADRQLLRMATRLHRDHAEHEHFLVRDLRDDTTHHIDRTGAPLVETKTETSAEPTLQDFVADNVGTPLGTNYHYGPPPEIFRGVDRNGHLLYSATKAQSIGSGNFGCVVPVEDDDGVIRAMKFILIQTGGKGQKDIYQDIVDLTREALVATSVALFHRGDGFPQAYNYLAPDMQYVQLFKYYSGDRQLQRIMQGPCSKMASNARDGDYVAILVSDLAKGDLENMAKEIVARGDRIEREQMRGISFQLCHTLATAEDTLGLVQRDIKLPNLLLMDDRRTWDTSSGQLGRSPTSDLLFLRDYEVRVESTDTPVVFSVPIDARTVMSADDPRRNDRDTRVLDRGSRADVPGVAVLTDFGLSNTVIPFNTNSFPGRVGQAGTPSYTPPEVFFSDMPTFIHGSRAEMGMAHDLYSMGVTLATLGCAGFRPPASRVISQRSRNFVQQQPLFIGGRVSIYQIVSNHYNNVPPQLMTRMLQILGLPVTFQGPMKMANMRAFCFAVLHDAFGNGSAPAADNWLRTSTAADTKRLYAAMASPEFQRVWREATEIETIDGRRYANFFTPYVDYLRQEHGADFIDLIRRLLSWAPYDRLRLGTDEAISRRNEAPLAAKAVLFHPYFARLRREPGSQSFEDRIRSYTRDDGRGFDVDASLELSRDAIYYMDESVYSARKQFRDFQRVFKDLDIERNWRELAGVVFNDRQLPDVETLRDNLPQWRLDLVREPTQQLNTDTRRLDLLIGQYPEDLDVLTRAFETKTDAPASMQGGDPVRDDDRGRRPKRQPLYQPPYMQQPPHQGPPQQQQQPPRYVYYPPPQQGPGPYQGRPPRGPYPPRGPPPRGPYPPRGPPPRGPYPGPYPGQPAPFRRLHHDMPGSVRGINAALTVHQGDVEIGKKRPRGRSGLASLTLGSLRGIFPLSASHLGGDE